MKKNISKILIFIGFAVVVFGRMLMIFTNETPMTPEANQMVNMSLIMIVLAVTFVFAKNAVLKNVGYGLATIVGLGGVNDLMLFMNDEAKVLPGTFIILAIGEVLVLVAVVLYFILICIKFFGFAKESDVKESSFDYDKIMKYKQMEAEGILSSEEFETVKAQIINDSDSKMSGIDGLKQWKKLLDKQIITEQEFDEIKTRILSKM